MKEKEKGSHNDCPNYNTAKVMVFPETAKFCTYNFYFARVFARVCFKTPISASAKERKKRPSITDYRFKCSIKNKNYRYSGAKVQNKIHISHLPISLFL